jgi:hypothetical protein
MLIAISFLVELLHLLIAFVSILASALLFHMSSRFHKLSGSCVWFVMVVFVFLNLVIKASAAVLVSIS